MSSHWKWAEKQIAQHDSEKPYAPENGQPLKFKVGDLVIYTNDNGISFGPFRISALFQPAEPCSLYATGYRYHLDKTAPWMPVRESSLQLAQ